MGKLLALSLIAAALGLSGCGVADVMKSSCTGSDIQDACDFLFGYEDRRQNNLIAELDADTRRLYQLVDKMNSLIRENKESNQIAINALQVMITELATSKTAFSIIDPCGDSPGIYDEILLRLEDGSTIAYFEHQGGRYLTELIPGIRYTTTDKTHCSFEINPYGEIENEVID